MTPNMPTETISYNCMAGEEEAWAHLHHRWADIAEGSRNRCIAASGGSNVILQRCIGSPPAGGDPDLGPLQLCHSEFGYPSGVLLSAEFR